MNLFADDSISHTSYFVPIEGFGKMNLDLRKLEAWSLQWRLHFNIPKTVYSVISKRVNRQVHPDLILNNNVLEEVSSHKQLGLIISNNLKWDEHVRTVCIKAMQRVNALKPLQCKLPRSTLEQIYFSFIRPILEYGSVVFDGLSQGGSDQLERVQREAAIVCTGAYRHTSHEALLKELGWDLLSVRRNNAKLKIMYKIQNNTAPNYLTDLFIPSLNRRRHYNLRNNDDIGELPTRLSCYKNSFVPSVIKSWNTLPIDLRRSPSLDSFSSKLKDIYCCKRNKLFSVSTGSVKGSRLLARLRMGLSGLNSHRNSYNFIDHSRCPNCNSQNEDINHYFLSCPKYAALRTELFQDIASVISPGVHHSLIIPTSKNEKQDFLNILLYGSENETNENNILIIKFVENYLLHSKRFDFQPS